MRTQKRLRFERSQRGLSQEGVGVIARVPQPTISGAERGRYIPSQAQLQRLAALLEVDPPEDLLKDVVVLESVR